MSCGSVRRRLMRHFTGRCPSFPVRGRRNRLQWSIYNLFMKKGSETDRKTAIAEPTEAPKTAPVPPILPIKKEWRQAVLEAAPLADHH